MQEVKIWNEPMKGCWYLQIKSDVLEIPEQDIFSMYKKGIKIDDILKNPIPIINYMETKIQYVDYEFIPNTNIIPV